MFPSFQQTPHSSWDSEVAYLDGVFQDRGEGKGNAYVVGKVNGDYWLLWMISPGVQDDDDPLYTPPAVEMAEFPAVSSVNPDYTIEILMSDLAPEAREPFFSPSAQENEEPPDPHIAGQTLSSRLGLDGLFPSDRTKLDAYAFTPCGYSANALIRGSDTSGEGYYTIHVTPEAGWSYASFECNVPLTMSASGAGNSSRDVDAMPDLQTLIARVVRVFRPQRLTLTLFVSNLVEAGAPGEAAVDAAHRAFGEALSGLDFAKEQPHKDQTNGHSRPKKYKRTDKINYDFGGYDLAFASFEFR